MMRRSLLCVAAFAPVVAICVAVAPPAVADGGQYVRTQSGKVRCWVTASGMGTGVKGPVVICEASGPENVGFLQAPMYGYGSMHYTGAVVDGAGNFSFQGGGNIGGANLDDDLVLSYGKSYNIQGWTIVSSPGGTRFTNNATGRGMFVSIENVYSF